MNEILSRNFSEKCLRRIGIAFMRYMKKYLSESIDVTAQYRHDHRSFHQCTILGYIY